MGTLIIIAVAVAFWLSIMAIAIALPISVKIIYITQPFICPPGSKLEIQTYKFSSHHGNQKGLQVLCRGPQGTRDVKGKALLALWLIFFLVSLLVCLAAVLLFGDQILAAFGG